MTSEKSNIFANMILKTRQQLMETQSEFAKRYGVSTNTVCRWETGAYQVPASVIEKLLENLVYEKPCPVCDGSGMVRAYPVFTKEINHAE